MAAIDDRDLIAGAENVIVLNTADLRDRHRIRHAENVVTELLQRLTRALRIKKLKPRNGKLPRYGCRGR